MVRVSIIIPCYNHGQYIDETLESIAEIENKNIFEIIIINDGSTDEFTNTRLEQLSKSYNVIFQKNKGLSGARNTGISHAKGDYILPLDADNKVKPEYLHTAIEIMDAQQDVDIVYADATYFGQRTGVFKSQPFNLQKLMLGNYIDACSIFRKSIWERNGGYDEQMKNGWEDWEFWLNAAFKGARFEYVAKELYDYRMLGDSMARTLNKDKTKVNDIIQYIKNKHPRFFGPQHIDTDITKKFLNHPIGFIVLLILKTKFKHRYEKLVKQGRLRKYI